MFQYLVTIKPFRAEGSVIAVSAGGRQAWPELNSFKTGLNNFVWKNFAFHFLKETNYNFGLFSILQRRLPFILCSYLSNKIQNETTSVSSPPSVAKSEFPTLLSVKLECVLTRLLLLYCFGDNSKSGFLLQCSKPNSYFH